MKMEGLCLTISIIIRIGHSQALHAVIGQLCGGEKRSQGLNFLEVPFFILSTTVSVTFHVNNGVQHCECLAGETV